MHWAFKNRIAELNSSCLTLPTTPESLLLLLSLLFTKVDHLLINCYRQYRKKIRRTRQKPANVDRSPSFAINYHLVQVRLPIAAAPKEIDWLDGANTQKIDHRYKHTGCKVKKKRKERSEKSLLNRQVQVVNRFLLRLKLKQRVDRFVNFCLLFSFGGCCRHYCVFIYCRSFSFILLQQRQQQKW